MKEMSKENKEIEGAGGVTLARNLIDWFKKEETKKTIKKIASYVAVALICLGIGFFAGRKKIGYGGNTQIIYVPGDSIKVEIDRPVPVYVKKPIDTANVINDCIKTGKYYELFPEKVRDNIVYITKADTSAVLTDWATERVYERKIFDIDTVGVATVRAKTQYNRITWLKSTFVPVMKQTTITNVVAKKYSPFAGVGITTMPEIVVNGGLFFEDKYGASVIYEYNWQTKQHAVGLMGTIKF